MLCVPQCRSGGGRNQTGERGKLGCDCLRRRTNPAFSALERYTDSIGRFPGAFKRRQKLNNRLVQVLAWSFAAISLAEPLADSSKNVA